MKSVKKHMGGGSLQALVSDFGGNAINSAMGAMGSHVGNYVANKILPQAQSGMKINKYKNGGKEPDYEGAVPPYNTRGVDPFLTRLLGALTRDMDKMKPKRAARVRKKAGLQGQTPEKFLQNRALARMILGLGVGSALGPQTGRRRLGSIR